MGSVGLAAGPIMQRVARGSCMAVIEWGQAAVALRDKGMKLGSCPSLLRGYGTDTTFHRTHF